MKNEEETTTITQPMKAEVPNDPNDLKDLNDLNEPEGAEEVEDLNDPKDLKVLKEEAGEAAGITEEELARAVEEAEQRGYLRGRNEAVSLAMQGDRLWEQPHAPEEPPTLGATESDAAFLRHIRPNVWD